MNLKRLAYLVPVLVGCAWVTTASGTLVLEPVIGFFPGHGPSADTFPLYDPTYVNEATGEQVSLARNPGEIDKWSMGYPREELMLTFGMYNNTPTNITSLAMTIVGSSQELVEGVSWLVTPDPNVDARFGDANGDGRIGLSDIFGSITVSNDGRTITLSNGLIPTKAILPTTSSPTRRMGCRSQPPWKGVWTGCPCRSLQPARCCLPGLG